jgi:Spy/CpxP family protein refolding chaperone
MIARALKGKLLVFGVFFIGIVTGMLIINFYETRVAGSPPDLNDHRGRTNDSQRDVNRVHDYLGLDQQQRDRVNEILEEGRTEVRQLRAETRPKVAAIEENTQARIREVLNPDQLTRYEEFRKSLRERGRKNRRPSGNN